MEGLVVIEIDALNHILSVDIFGRMLAILGDCKGIVLRRRSRKCNDFARVA